VYLRKVCRRPGVIKLGLLKIISGYAVRKLLQFGAFGIEKPLEHACLSYFGGLGGPLRQNACGSE
jgi:hypothetical protein